MVTRLVWKESKPKRASGVILQQYRHFPFYIWNTDWYCTCKNWTECNTYEGHTRREIVPSL